MAIFPLIKEKALAIGKNFREVLGIYLIGSVARGDADPESDLDLLFVMRDSNTLEFYASLSKNAAYRALENWAYNFFEGGVSPLILTPRELRDDYDTVLEHALQAGVTLYGPALHEIMQNVPKTMRPSSPTLWDLVQSL